eukprot:COSAG01_NODE_1365_length_10560_cov_38.008986_5_plen_158_part_00
MVSRSHRLGCPAATAAAAATQRARGRSHGGIGAGRTDDDIALPAATCKCPFVAVAPYRKVWHVLGLASVSREPEHAGRREALIGRLDTEAAEHTIRGPVTLQQQAAEESWILFQNPGGTRQGELRRGARGLTLVTTSGDFAGAQPLRGSRYWMNPCD